MFPALLQVGTAGFPFTPGYSTPSPGSPLRVFALVEQFSCSCGRWSLTHWHYFQSVRGRWCPRQCVLQQRSLPTGSLSSFLPQGGSSSFTSSALLVKREAISKSPKTQNTTISDQCLLKLQKPSVHYPL